MNRLRWGRCFSCVQTPPSPRNYDNAGMLSCGSGFQLPNTAEHVICRGSWKFTETCCSVQHILGTEKGFLEERAWVSSAALP